MGGFYTAEDADSFPSKNSKEKVEGAFYVWEAKELDSILDRSDVRGALGCQVSEIFKDYFDVKPLGNVPVNLVGFRCKVSL